MSRCTGVTQILQTVGHRLWIQGWTDPMIASHLGCTKSTVCRWRSLLGLEPNAPTGSETWRDQFYKRDGVSISLMTLHESGMTDAEMSPILKISRVAVMRRRNRLGLSPNHTDGRGGARVSTSKM